MVKEEVQVLKSFDIPTGKIEWRADGILKITLLDNAHITLKDSVEMFEILKSLSSGKKDMLVITIAGEETNYDAEVREFAMTEECSRYTLAEAVVVKSLAQKILVNFTLKFYKLHRHIKMFTSELEAMDWLNSFKPEILK